jgi:hypothetical protein
MTQALGWLYLLASVGSVIDGGRFSYAEWQAAQRNKNFWLTILFFFSLLFVLPYLLSVRPELKTARIVRPKGQP